MDRRTVCQEHTETDKIDGNSENSQYVLVCHNQPNSFEDKN